MRNLFVRDEREAAVEQGGDRLAYLVVSYGLLLIVAYRSLVERQASWDLLALVVLGGIVSVGYRMSRRALSRNALFWWASRSPLRSLSGLSSRWAFARSTRGQASAARVMLDRVRPGVSPHNRRWHARAHPARR